MDYAHTILEYIVNVAILFFECIGVIVIIISGVRGAKNLFRKEPMTKLYLAKGMSMGLEFKLGSEILRTVVVRDMSEIVIVAGIIALRAGLALLIHWEIKNEETKKEKKLSMSIFGKNNEKQEDECESDSVIL